MLKKLHVLSVRFKRRHVGPRPATLLSGLQLQKRVDPAGRQLLLSRGRKSLATLTLGSSKINQHCWRFHGSGVIAAPQIIGLISFCTGMHHEYVLRLSMCFCVPHLCSKIPKINHWIGEFATVIWRLHCFTVSFRGDIRGESGQR